MKRLALACSLIVLLSALVYTGCGPGGACEPGTKQFCQCGPLQGQQTCQEDGSAYGACTCGAVEPTTELTKDAGTEPSVEPTKAEPTTDHTEPTTDRAEPTQDAGDTGEVGDAGADMLPEKPKDEAPTNCAADEFSYQGQCYKNEDFCKSQTANQAFPLFTQDAQKGMATPFQVILDPNTKKPLFCKTKEGYYYLGSSGYGQCDKDGDGWINIEAYRAVTSTEASIKENARCSLRSIDAIVYTAENQQPQIQRLDKSVPLVETFRNDGGGKAIELPVYTTDQKALPKTTSGLCSDSAGCMQGETCYLGQCIEGRRFAPAELNTLTKACIANIDLNDNKIDDASESPSDTPDPANEFKPLLLGGYFIELHYGYYQKDFDDKGSKLAVYHIKERARTGSNGPILALNCQEKKDAFQPDHWKKCDLKDNQQCPDPNDPNATKLGLTSCWLKDVKRLTPSLFKCVVHDNTTDPSTQSGFFHPSNHGFDKNYSRSVCSFKKTNALSVGTNQNIADVEVACSADDGSRSPDPSRKIVGWACVSFAPYTKQEDYLGGCVDEKTERKCGDTKDGKAVTYFTLEKDSYGLVRAGASCGQSNGVGQCDAAIRVCTGGAWLDCNKCDNCPQNTDGQKAACPGGVWPTGSCKLVQGPTAEKCNNLDDDCDGQIDEGLPKISYYKDVDKDSYGDISTKVDVCAARKPTGYVTRAGDCNDNNAQIKPGVTDVCDNIDNDCDGSIDENATKKNWYKDYDGDKQGAGSGITGCRKGGTDTNPSFICKGTKNAACIAGTQTDNNNKRFTYVSNNNDCCDADANVKKGQTSYFSTPSTSCPNNQGGWDYNCSGSKEKDTRNMKLCSCAQQVTYTQTNNSYCNVHECSFGWLGPKASCSGLCTTDKGTNAGNRCQLTFEHYYEMTQDFKATCNRKCKVLGSGSYTHSCGKNSFNSSATSNKNRLTWTPGQGGTPYMAISKNQYGGASVCHFMKDGSVPDCGQTTSTLRTSDATSTPTHDVNNESFCSGSKKQCTVTWGARCYKTFKVTYSSNFYYFKTTSISAGSQVKCR